MVQITGERRIKKKVDHRVTVGFSLELYEKLSDLADIEQTSLCSLVRRAVVKFLAEEGEGENVSS